MERDHMTRRDFLKILGAGSAALSVGERLRWSAAFAAERKPNILLIFADDLGYAELGCQGSTDIPTPNIDSLAKNGVRLTDGYVSCPVCSPTRAGLMTGRYQQRFGHEHNPGPAGLASAEFGLPLTETTFASRIKAGGYATGLVGKWHLGNFGKRRPLERGFDEFFGFLGGGHPYLHDAPGGARGIMRGNEEIEEKEYLTDAFAREAVAFIERHREQPFFLYLSFNAVHGPLQATEKYLDRFRDIKDDKRRTFAAMLSAMDDGVGRVMTALRDRKLEDDTLVFFISDNGGPTPRTTSRNDPLRGYKGQVYEGGIRVPFLMQWKGRLPAGVIRHDPVISLDIAPTALAAAGIKAEGAKFDGRDLLPHLTKRPKRLLHDGLYWRLGPQSAIRKGDWKLVKMAQAEPELYDLAADIGEKTNLAADNPDRVEELDGLLRKWDGELAEPLWYGRQRRAARRLGDVV